MRVISGEARGRKLKEPRGMRVRPTADKVKEAMFSILQFDLPGKRVLDLFAGTGQLGIEALSRGAESAVFVDASEESLRLVRENLALTGFASRSTVVRSDGPEYLKRCEPFDIVLLDPPYDTPLIDQALSGIIEFDILRNGGIIICETKCDRQLAAFSEPYTVRREYRYGTIKRTVIDRQEVAEP